MGVFDFTGSGVAMGMHNAKAFTEGFLGKIDSNLKTAIGMAQAA